MEETSQPVPSSPAITGDAPGLTEHQAAAKISALIAPKPPRADDGKFAPRNPQPVAEQPAAPEPSPEPEAAPTEATSDEDDIEIDDGESTAPDDNRADIDMPKSWSSADRSEWDKLTPEAKAIVQRREMQRDHGMRQLADKLKGEEARVSETLKQMEQQQLQLAQAAQRYVSDAVKQFQAKFGDVKDVNALARENPARYVEMDAAWRAIQAAEAEAGMLAQQQEHAKAKDFADWRAQENQKLVELAGLKDEASATAFEKQVVEFTGKLGIPIDRVQQYHAVELMLVQDALKWRNAVSKKEAARKAANPPPPVLRPGAPTSKANLSKQANQEQLSRTLRKTGSEQDAAKLIKSLVFR